MQIICSIPIENYIYFHQNKLYLFVREDMYTLYDILSSCLLVTYHSYVTEERCQLHNQQKAKDIHPNALKLFNNFCKENNTSATRKLLDNLTRRHELKLFSLQRQDERCVIIYLRNIN